MVAPIQYSEIVERGVVVPVTPLKVVMLAPKEDASGSITAVPGSVNTLYNVSTDAGADAALGMGRGTSRKGRRWRDALESAADVELWALLYDVPDANFANAALALDELVKSSQLALLDNHIDVVLVPEIGFGTTTSEDTIGDKLASVVNHIRVRALGILDGYQSSGLNQTPADLDSWQQAALGNGCLAISNTAGFNGVTSEWGSVVAAAHILRYASSRGVGAHPFGLNDPVHGAGAVKPVFAFNELDGSSDAVTLDGDTLSTFISVGGVDYLYGGNLKAAGGATDPRSQWGNAMLYNRIAKRLIVLARASIGRVATSALQASAKANIGNHLSDEFVGPAGVEGVGNVDVTFTNSGRKINVSADVRFYGIIETVAITVTLSYA